MLKIKNKCPCGSTTDYPACCGKYHAGEAIPQTPEALMRSRYTAYAKADMSYIKHTMQGKPLLGFNETEAKTWATSIQWIGLDIINAYFEETDEDNGFVEFIATYLEMDALKTIHEISQFQRMDNRWFYIDNKYPTEIKQKKIPRNATCPCGSQKKYKNCHAKK